MARHIEEPELAACPVKRRTDAAHVPGTAAKRCDVDDRQRHASLFKKSSKTRSTSWRAAESPEPDPACARLFAVHDHIEAVFHIERDVALVLGLQIASELLGVCALEHRAHQRATESAPLTARRDTEQEQVPAGAGHVPFG